MSGPHVHCTVYTVSTISEKFPCIFGGSRFKLVYILGNFYKHKSFKPTVYVGYFFQIYKFESAALNILGNLFL